MQMPPLQLEEESLFLPISYSLNPWLSNYILDVQSLHKNNNNNNNNN